MEPEELYNVITKLAPTIVDMMRVGGANISEACVIVSAILVQITVECWPDSNVDRYRMIDDICGHAKISLSLM
jgi:hypothetical protein